MAIYFCQLQHLQMAVLKLLFYSYFVCLFIYLLLHNFGDLPFLQHFICFEPKICCYLVTCFYFFPKVITDVTVLLSFKLLPIKIVYKCYFVTCFVYHTNRLSIYYCVPVIYVKLIVSLNANVYNTVPTFIYSWHKVWPRPEIKMKLPGAAIRIPLTCDISRSGRSSMTICLPVVIAKSMVVSGAAT